MAFLIGTDEAGYGPRLGPLLITATVWQVPDQPEHPDLYALLDGQVSRTRPPAGDPRIAVGDSKRLYRPGYGWAALERGVLAFLAVLGQTPTTWRSTWQALAPASTAGLREAPWYAEYDAPLPRDAPAAEIAAAADWLHTGLAQAGISLRAMRSAAVFPARWNELVDARGNKADVLALETICLLQEVLAQLEPSTIFIQCDKLGGRDHYVSLLQLLSPDQLVRVVRETRAVSVYRWELGEQRVECRFTAGGEAFLPSALASMTSKYLRELAMEAFNVFWKQQLPWLRATAGYPADALRFREEIASLQRRLGIPDRLLWRTR